MSQNPVAEKATRIDRTHRTCDKRAGLFEVRPPCDRLTLRKRWRREAEDGEGAMTITYQLRTLIAETLLKLALRIMPPGMESGSLEAALR